MKKRLLQKLLGIITIIGSIYVAVGTKDLTLLFVTLPLGLYALFTKSKLF